MRILNGFRPSKRTFNTSKNGSRLIDRLLHEQRKKDIFIAHLKKVFVKIGDTFKGTKGAAFFLCLERR
jgi:hypothetical protein